jgi:isocitrate/isopropylmalate dehydrogenase
MGLPAGPGHPFRAPLVAPDIAHRGVANQSAATWSRAVMLGHLGEPAAAATERNWLTAP